MAIKANQDGILGTRTFQSVAVLSFPEWEAQSPPQDHLDDLESSFYVLAWMCHKYDGTNVSLSPEFLSKWEVDRADLCADAKSRFLGNPAKDLPPYSNTEIFKTLLNNFAGLCEAWTRQKTATIRTGGTFLSLKQTYDNNKGEDHDQFLGFIDKAIEAQRLQPDRSNQNTESDRQHVSRTTQLPDAANHPGNDTFHPARASRKRPAADAGLDDPAMEDVLANSLTARSASKRIKSSGEGSVQRRVGSRTSARLAAAKEKAKEGSTGLKGV